MSTLDHRKKPSTMINLTDDEQDDVSPPPAKQTKISSPAKKTSKTIKKTASAGPKLLTNPTNSSTQPTTISALLGIVDVPVKSNLTPPKPVQTLKPGSFRITLCIDNAEASRSSQKALLDHLTKNSINYDIRKLNIGDFLWTVRRTLSTSYFPITSSFILQQTIQTFKSKPFWIISWNENDWTIYRRVLLTGDIMNKKWVCMPEKEMKGL